MKNKKQEQSDAKKNVEHTPTPWKVDGNRIIQTFVNESWNKQIPVSREDVVIGTFNSCDQAEQAVRAVNSHEALIKALKTLVEHAKETYPHFEDVRGQKDIFNALQALAQAERGSNPHNVEKP